MTDESPKIPDLGPAHDARPDTKQPETYLPQVEQPAHDARPFLVPEPVSEEQATAEPEPVPKVDHEPEPILEEDSNAS